jgi:hypothetical protein
MAHVPKAAMRGDAARDIERIFNATEADRRLKETKVACNRKCTPAPAAWSETDVPKAVTVFGVFLRAPPVTANEQRLFATQQGNETPHLRRHAVPKRGIVAQAGLGSHQ